LAATAATATGSIALLKAAAHTKSVPLIADFITVVFFVFFFFFTVFRPPGRTALVACALHRGAATATAAVLFFLRFAGVPLQMTAFTVCIPEKDGRKLLGLVPQPVITRASTVCLFGGLRAWIRK